MKNGQVDNKILFLVIGITLLVLGAVLINKFSSPRVERIDSIETESITDSDPRVDTVLEEPLEEGLGIALTTPNDRSIVNNSVVTIAGQTEADAEVFINENELKADSSGNFSAEITLEEGENIIVITVSDDEGNYAEQALVLTYEPLE